MGAATPPARICPECGTRNSGLSLFCSECGASLAGASPEGSGDSQTTSVFTPASSGTTSSDPYATQQFRPQTATTTSSQATIAGAPAANGWTEATTHTNSNNGYARQEESRRGLVLGWIAAVLMLLVIGYLGWTSFLDADTRDTIIGWFS